MPTACGITVRDTLTERLKVSAIKGRDPVADHFSAESGG